jgi:hypothetical protein
VIRGAWAWARGTLGYLVGSPAAALLVAGAGLSGALSGAPVGERLYDYMWRDPVFCGDCHVHDYANEAWARSVHSELTTCHDCHRVPIRHYPRNLYKAVFARPSTPEDVPSAHVGAVLCEQCHAEDGGEEPLTGPMPGELRAMVAKVDGSPLHRAHLDATRRTPGRYAGGHGGPAKPEATGHAADGGISCLDCHGGKDLQVHTFSADSRDCVECHEGITPTDERGGELSCLDCHGRGFVGPGRRSSDEEPEQRGSTP